MESQTQTTTERRALSVFVTFCYLLALAGVCGFSYLLLNFAFRLAAQQTRFLYSLPV